MARSPDVALHVPSEARRPARRDHEEDRPQLRLVVTRGQLGIELGRPFRMAPLVVEEMALSLPEVRFPVELSGGATGFRHKRGRLERLALSIAVGDAQRFSEARWKQVLDGDIVHRLTAPLEDGWLAGLATAGSALAFEVLIAPHDGDIRFVPTAARGMGLAAPPQALALQALAALFKPHAAVVGGTVVLEGAPMLLVRELLPLAGVRVPDARAIAWTEAQFDVGELWLRAEREHAPWTAGARALRALELAALVGDAEEALVRGDLERARHGYLDALARAPRHLELSRRLAEVDRAVGNRAEAALSTIGDVVPPADAGPLGAALLLAVGDRAGARHAFTRAAEQEPYGALAALCWLEAAACSDEGGDELLDEAVARAPVLPLPRWRRFERHVRDGRMSAARGDIEHLEAAAQSASERHEVARRAAAFLAGERAYDEACSMYERALRYAPDSAEAVAGLARALEALGHGRRALELMGRAVTLAARKQQPAHALRLSYASLIAEQADDRPLAIAQVRVIPPHVRETFEARLYEARWRAELGDLSGASEALARLVDAVEASVVVLVAAGEDERSRVAQLLLEGARIHEIDRRDVAAARRLLALGLRLAPRRGPIQRAYERLPPPSSSSEAVTAPRPRVEPSPHSITLDVDVGVVQAVRDEVRAEELTTELRANPANEAVATELADTLERLGRHHELLALLSARVEETEGEKRASWLGRRRVALDRLIAEAAAAGRHDEAELYRSLREAGG